MTFVIEGDTVVFKRMDFVDMIPIALERMRSRLSVKCDGKQWIPPVYLDRVSVLIPKAYEYELISQFKNEMQPIDYQKYLVTHTDCLLGKFSGIDIYTLSPDYNIHFVDKKGLYPSVSFKIKEGEL